MKKIMVSVALVALCAFLFSGCGFVWETAESSKSSEIAAEYGWNPANATTEENSTARFDEICLKAKADAESISDDDADILWEECFQYLKAHQDNFFENNEVMEKSMYYGTFLYEYIEAKSNADSVADLADSVRAAYDAGYNTVKAIKYVYRGVDKIDDESTQNALKEAQDNLDKFL